jgi:pimeloyl-ACP methyl ester carboxylesterase
VVRAVPATLEGPLVPSSTGPGRVPGVADLVAAGEGLDGGRVRVLETSRPGGGSAWVVVVPGTQEWSPRAGANPFDLTTDVRALTGEATVAAAAVAAALGLARSRSGRAAADDPVLLVGHSQGGILAAALASDPAFTRGHRVTHLVTTGAPVGLFPVPSRVRVLSVEHADDPVPRLDLTPNPAHATWLTVSAPAATCPVDLDRHRLAGYVATVRVVEGAPRGTVRGLDAWQASAGAFLGAPVRSVSEVVVERGWHNPRS